MDNLQFSCSGLFVWKQDSTIILPSKVKLSLQPRQWIFPLEHFPNRIRPTSRPQINPMPQKGMNWIGTKAFHIHETWSNIFGFNWCSCQLYMSTKPPSHETWSNISGFNWCSCQLYMSTNPHAAMPSHGAASGASHPTLHQNSHHCSH